MERETRKNNVILTQFNLIWFHIRFDISAEVFLLQTQRNRTILGMGIASGQKRLRCCFQFHFCSSSVATKWTQQLLTHLFLFLLFRHISLTLTAQTWFTSRCRHYIWKFRDCGEEEVEDVKEESNEISSSRLVFRIARICELSLHEQQIRWNVSTYENMFQSFLFSHPLTSRHHHHPLKHCEIISWCSRSKDMWTEYLKCSASSSSSPCLWMASDGAQFAT